MAERRTLRPRLAASLLTVDHSAGEPRILMGRRSDAHVFMPGYHVFPGGGVERSDYRGPQILDDDQVAAVMRGLPVRATPNNAQTIARAALREMAEETGIVAKDDKPPSLHYLGRAITPPGQVRRYDTRFFIAERNGFQRSTSPPDNELLQLEWVPMSRLDGLKIHRITAFMLKQAQSFLEGNRTELRPCAYTRYGKHSVRSE